jgi:hypothetical protein
LANIDISSVECRSSVFSADTIARGDSHAEVLWDAVTKNPATF